MDQATDRFPMHAPDPAWEAANPGWAELPPDDLRWRPAKGDKSGNLRPEKKTTPAREIKLSTINPVDLAGLPVPPRTWIVSEWLPVGCVTLSYGDGGVGKTLLAQQLMSSTALGARWCGMEVMPCRSLALFCEDDEAELHRRQVAICNAYGAGLADLEAMRWVSGVGNDNTLIAFDYEGRGQQTPLFDAIRKEAIDHGASLVVLDTAADLFGGNENDRRQVRQFIGLLNRLALDIDGAVLLNAHPSRSGLASGNIDGGSTGWNNSARSRWTLERPVAEDGAEPETDARVLTKRKANYSSIGDSIRLEWRNGALVSPNASGGLRIVDRAAAEIVFLDLLAARCAQGVYVSHNSRAGNYAPKAFGKSADRKGYTAKDFEAAMGRLFDAKKIVAEVYGRTGDARQRIAIVPPAEDTPDAR
jgi:hypothetical protein